MYKSKCNIQSKVKPEHTKAKDFFKKLHSGVQDDFQLICDTQH